MPTELLSFAGWTVRRRFVREDPHATRDLAARPFREPDGERFIGETILRDLPRVDADAANALRIIGRYLAVRALGPEPEPAATEVARAASAYLAALDGAAEARALRAAINAPPGSAARFAALMRAAREAERWKHWHGALALRRLAWSLAEAGDKRKAAVRAARALARVFRRLDRTAEARRWRQRALLLSDDEAGL